MNPVPACISLHAFPLQMTWKNTRTESPWANACPGDARWSVACVLADLSTISTLQLRNILLRLQMIWKISFSIIGLKKAIRSNFFPPVENNQGEEIHLVCDDQFQRLQEKFPGTRAVHSFCCHTDRKKWETMFCNCFAIDWRWRTLKTQDTIGKFV